MMDEKTLMSPDPRLSELLEKWNKEAASLAREARRSYPHERERGVYCDGKSIGFTYCRTELAAVLLGGTPQPQEPSTANAVMDGGCVVLTGEARAWQSIFDNAWQTIARQGKEIAGLQKQLAKERRAASGGIASSPTLMARAKALNQNQLNAWCGRAFPEHPNKRVGGEYYNCPACLLSQRDHLMAELIAAFPSAAPVRPVQEKE